MASPARKKRTRTLPALPSVKLPPAIQRYPIKSKTGLVLREAIVEAASWRDPSDLAPNARAPKVVTAFRRVDQLQRLHEGGSISQEHLNAGKRFCATRRRRAGRGQDGN